MRAHAGCARRADRAAEGVPVLAGFGLATYVAGCRRRYSASAADPLITVAPGVHRDAAAPVALMFAGAVVTARTDRAVFGDRFRGLIGAAAFGAGVAPLRAAFLAHRLAVDAVRHRQDLPASIAWAVTGRVRASAPGAHCAVVLSERGRTGEAASHTDNSVRSGVAAGADRGVAVVAVGQRSLPVAAVSTSRTVHLGVIGSEHVEEAAHACGARGVTGGQCVRMGAKVCENPCSVHGCQLQLVQSSRHGVEIGSG
ncbi:hypothetical protein [Rhodococcus sp. H29-C3]|uniref:hypothetical protein n=1 Tax=Rhodococcus sp. H29-C3 TaxID=3046307 RepID=UPI0024BB58D5|nr:hypothetical protein [Rhodococcus sp. H29-C3]MDJ0363358.1 hypothetical protein [Rhodococcus sp. H29-C3]